MAKEGYKPTAGMKAAAKRAIRWKEQGKATGAGTAGAACGTGGVTATPLIRDRPLRVSCTDMNSGAVSCIAVSRVSNSA